ncbi:MAG: hypothetical protein V1924_04290 [Candidatus Bathyarchaeota archaeon]
MNTRRLTLMAILAAVYAVGSYLPGFPMLGLPGSKIDLVRALEIGYGVVLGPVYGPVTAFLGAIVGKTLTGGGVGLFFTPLAPVTAFVASMLARRGGWRYSAAVTVALILGWYGTSVGWSARVVTVLHLAGLLVVLVFRDGIREMVSSGDKRRLAIGFFLCSFPSTLAGHLLGNIIFAVMFSPSAEFFVAILPVSAVERLVISVIATVFGSSLVVAVRQIYPTLLE